MSLSDTTAKLQGQSLWALKANQDAILSVVKPLAGLTAPIVGLVPAQLSAYIPDSTELVEQWFDFAAEILAAQKSFVARLVGVVPTGGKKVSPIQAAVAA